MQRQVLPSLVNPAAQLWQNEAVLAQAVQMGLQGLQEVAPSARKVPVAHRQAVPWSTNPGVQDWQLLGLSWQLAHPTPQLAHR